MGLTNLGNEADPVLTRIIEEDKVQWYKKPNLRYLYFLLYFTCMGIEITSGFDSQMINALQIVPSWTQYFGFYTLDAAGKGTYIVPGPLLGIISCSYNLGAIFAVPVVPWVAQKWGRRWSIFIGSVIMVVGSIIQGFSQHAAMYIVARMILGFGIVFAIVSGSAMLGELSYPKERPFMTSMFNASWFLGSLIASGITVGTATIANDWGWRVPSILQACPSLVQIALVFLIPESPRWLISKDRRDEAFDILVKYHAEGDRDSVFVKAEMAQIETTIHLELEAAKQSWMDMIRSPGMRRRTVLASCMGVFTQFSGNTLISFYLSKILAMIGYTDAWTKSMINFGSAIWSLVNGTTIALISPRFPRRTMFLTCACSMLLIYVCWTVTMKYAMDAYAAKTSNGAAAIAMLVFIFLYSLAYNIGNNSLAYTYLVELFPFAERSRGIAVEQFWVRVSGTFTTFVNPIGMDAVGWKYLIMYNCFICVEIAIIYFFYPETYGRTLEELAFLFEDKDDQDKATMAVEKAIHGDDDKIQPYNSATEVVHAELDKKAIN